MKITIVCVGKLKEKYWCDAVAEYKKRLSKYTNLELIEVKDESFVEESKILELEKAKINKKRKGKI